ncbi:lipopolysaccharide biosynthesis protein, partial [Clostridium perfringens]
PSLKFINLKYSKILLNCGVKFFFIQTFNIIIFATDSMIITHYLGPNDVIGYQLTYKIFSVYTMIFGIILIPLWSAFTEAYTKNNIIWIKEKLRKLIGLFLISIILIILTSVFCNFIIQIWMGEDIKINLSLIILMGISTIITIWFSIFSYISNGIGRLNTQLFTYIIGGILNIPLSKFLALNVNLGVDGVILSTIICISLFAILGPIDIITHLNKKMN